MAILRLENPVMSYSWGSRDGLPAILGLANPEGRPMAESWMGAHPKAPSRLLHPAGTRGLDEHIAADPEACLGLASIEAFGPRLPFLFKLLSAAHPLSIQVHPGLRRAGRGFEAEERSGMPRDAGARNYRDPNHKPELAVALDTGRSPCFEALSGFRPIDEILDFGRDLANPAHRLAFDRLGRRPGRVELSIFLHSILRFPEAGRPALIAAALELASQRLLSGKGSIEAPALRWMGRIAERFPGDIGALAPIFLNYLVLEPGQGLFVGPGEPHAYLGGTALEIMANSDNVIRGCITDKHVDVAEFISNLDFVQGKPALVPTSLSGGSELVYETPAAEFVLSSIRPPLAELGVEGAEILLCSEGELGIEWAGGGLGLRQGDSAFVEAATGRWSVGGRGRLWRARVAPSRRGPSA